MCNVQHRRRLSNSTVRLNLDNNIEIYKYIHMCISMCACLIVLLSLSSPGHFSIFNENDATDDDAPDDDDECNTTRCIAIRHFSRNICTYISFWQNTFCCLSYCLIPLKLLIKLNMQMCLSIVIICQLSLSFHLFKFQNEWTIHKHLKYINSLVNLPLPLFDNFCFGPIHNNYDHLNIL